MFGGIGAVRSTAKVVLGPAPVVSAKSARFVAVPAAMVIPIVPSPAVGVTVTVRVLVPDPVTVTVPLADPVLFKVMLAGARVMLLAPE